MTTGLYDLKKKKRFHHIPLLCLGRIYSSNMPEYVYVKVATYTHAHTHTHTHTHTDADLTFETNML